MILLLPRQFHMTVVENRTASEIRRARWLFPLYLVVINLFVVPIAVAGRSRLGPSVDADLYVLSLPLSPGRTRCRWSPSSAACRPRPPW